MSIEIDGHEIRQNESPFIVAEIGMNHNGDVDLGIEMIQTAAESGADAVKFQSFRTDEFLSGDVGNRDDYRRYELSREEHQIFQEEARNCEVTFFSTPLDRTSVDMLEDLGVPCFKVASSDLTNLPFLEYIAEKQKPLIMSTGYSSFSEVAEAVETIRSVGNKQFVLLQCLSTYPAPPEDMNLRTLSRMHRAFGCPVGLSDHSQDTLIPPVVATSLGAGMVEKHFTIDQSLPGFDHGMSTEPDEFQRMVSSLEMTVQALGDGEKQPHEAELQSRENARRSLYWKGSFPQGKNVERDMITEKRPGTGISSQEKDIFIGKKLAQSVEADRQVRYSDCEL